MGNEKTDLNNLLSQHTSDYCTDWAEFRVATVGKIFRNKITRNIAFCRHLLLELEELVRVSVVMGTARIGSILVPECLQSCTYIVGRVAMM